MWRQADAALAGEVADRADRALTHIYIHIYGEGERERHKYMCIYIYICKIYTYIYTCVYVYIYIYVLVAGRAAPHAVAALTVALGLVAGLRAAVRP